MFASKGLIIPPCGVPSVVSLNVRFSITPERRNFQIPPDLVVKSQAVDMAEII
jgi:hypothetical protein